ncbi:MAG: hypothetical protein OXG42_09885 [Chloroflexi bacterium]|nr:hypothetical protein [Chloroflexota bacterium]
MPPRVRLTNEETERLPSLLSLIDGRRHEFPGDAHPSVQAHWIADRYADESPLTINLITLLLFEHGVHRSVNQVSQDLAILPEDTDHE